MKLLNNTGSKTKGFMAKMQNRYKLSNKEPPKMVILIKV